MGDAMRKTEEVEAEIPPAMRARVAYFKEQADSLTLEDVRRTLEVDLKMDKFSLDVHKKFIKQCLDKCFFDADDEIKSKISGEIAKETVQSVKQATSIRHQDLQRPDKMKSPGSSVIEPAAGEMEKSHGAGSSSDVSEATVRAALKQKAAFIKANIEEISAVDVRRMLEEDLELEKYTLDAYKRFIKEELPVVLSAETIEATNGVKKKLKQASQSKETEKKSKVSKGASRGSDSLDSNGDLSEDEDSEDEDIKEERKPKKMPAEKVKVSTKAVKNQKTSKEEGKSSSSRKRVSKGASRGSDSLDSNGDLSEDDDSEDEDIKEEIKPKKRPAEKVKVSTKAVKKQKTSKEEGKSSSSRKKKVTDQDLDLSSESESRNASEDRRSDSSAEESMKMNKEKPIQAYGKQVERLKLIIKSCGMSVPPTVYKRAKQAPENKREAFLIKELEDILEKEGLSTNPSEKEIKAVKRTKERAKELEGIDMSNIVSSRRRSTSSYIPLPKPKIDVESEDNEEDEDDRNEEESDDGDSDSGDSGEGSDEDADEGSD